jgi:hypothetical protein
VGPLLSQSAGLKRALHDDSPDESGLPGRGEARETISPAAPIPRSLETVRNCVKRKARSPGSRAREGLWKICPQERTRG